MGGMKLSPALSVYYGSFLALLAAISIAFVPNLAKILYAHDVGIVTVVMVRSLVLLVLLSPIFFIKNSFRLFDIRLSCASAVCFLLMSIGYVGGVNYMDVGLVTIVYFSHPVLVMLWYKYQGRQSVNRYTFLTIICVVMGLFLTVGIHDSNITVMGVAFAIMASVACTGMIILNSHQLTQGRSAFAVNYEMALISTLILYGFYFHDFNQAMTAEIMPNWGLLTLIGVCFTIGLSVFFISFRYISSVRATFITLLQPVFVVFIDYMWFDTLLHPVQYLGGVMIVLAIVLSEYDKVKASA